jgi:hypothetical protein
MRRCAPTESGSGLRRPPLLPRPLSWVRSLGALSFLAVSAIPAFGSELVVFGLRPLGPNQAWARMKRFHIIYTRRNIYC